MILSAKYTYIFDAAIAQYDPGDPKILEGARAEIREILRSAPLGRLASRDADRLVGVALTETRRLAETLGLLRSSATLVGVDRYVAMSALQKAVRLQDLQGGLLALNRLFELGERTAAWRRLRVIAVEDIGLADPAVCCLVLWMAGNCAVRSLLGDYETACAALSLLTSAVKSRDMCDLAVWSDLPGSIDREIAEHAFRSAGRLIEIACDPERTLRARLAATRALYPFRFRRQEPWNKRRRAERLALYERLGTSAEVAFLVESDVQFGGESIAWTGPVAELLLRSSGDCGAGRHPFDGPSPLPNIGRTTTATYDRHTGLGKRAIRTLLAENEPLRGFFQRHPHAEAMDCLLRAVFYVEGSILRPQLTYRGGEDLFWSVLQDKFASTGIPDLDPIGFELLDLTRDALPHLHELRVRLLGRLGAQPGA